MKTLKKPKVFIAHGRDDVAKTEVSYYLHKLGLDPIVLHERPNSGRTLITKFEEESKDVEFAVVLMTPDDVGKHKDEEKLHPRARQNVIFELGFFIGKISAKKVCALVSPSVERPSDFEAIVYVEYGKQTLWKVELARELKAAGIPFDSDAIYTV